jgi:FG-GAP repeat
VYVYTRSGSTWTEQAKLTPSPGSREWGFGESVALSADGNTALIGGTDDHEETGAAWVFRRSGSDWSQQEKLTGPGESGEARFGYNVALSSEATTALIGAPGDDAERGAAWLFTGLPWSVPSDEAPATSTTGGPATTGTAATPASAAVSTGPAAAAAGSSTTSGSTANAPAPPAITGAAQSNQRWREGKPLTAAHRPLSAPLGTTFSFVLDGPASVSLAFIQDVRGRRVKDRCVTQTQTNRREPACVRTVTRGVVTFAGRAGANRISFDGRLPHASRLAPGSYTVLITATGAGGRRLPPTRLSFTVVASD